MTQILRIRDKEDPAVTAPITIGPDEERKGIEILADEKIDWLAADDAVTLARALQLEADKIIKHKTPLTRWLEACCRPSPDWTPVTELYWSWQAWCAENGEEPGSLVGFGRRLTKMFSKKRAAAGWVYAVGLKDGSDG
jgi:phage/plasmid-associated DNA primase